MAFILPSPGELLIHQLVHYQKRLETENRPAAVRFLKTQIHCLTQTEPNDNPVYVCTYNVYNRSDDKRRSALSTL